MQRKEGSFKAPSTGIKLGKISPEQLTGTAHHSAASSRARAHLQTRKATASAPLRSKQAACQRQSCSFAPVEERNSPRRRAGNGTEGRAEPTPPQPHQSEGREEIRLRAAFLQSRGQQSNSPSRLDSGKWLLPPASPLLPYH